MANHGIKRAILVLFSGRILIPLLLVFALNFANTAVIFIEPTAAGVVVSITSPSGVRDEALDPGFHFILPLLEKVELYTIAWQTYTMANNPQEINATGNDSIRARTKDGQEVLLSSSLIFRLDPTRAVEVHTLWQKRYIEELVRPIIRGYIRGEVSRFRVEEVNSSQRVDLEATLTKRLREKLAEEGFILNEFLLRDIAFSPQYALEIEEKQSALEKITRIQNEAAQAREAARGRADAVKIEAQARARAFNLLGDALKENPDLLTLEYINKLSPNIKAMLVPNNAPLILPLPELEESNTSTTTLESVLPSLSPVPTITSTPSPRSP